MENNKRQELKNLLDKTGPGFCLAKWTQVTMHLGPGLTHSCHHPGAHKIPLNELAENPSALHNTNYKKEIRKQMLNGERPKECDYCWRVEDNTKEFSDRVNKSLEKWSIGSYTKIVNSTGDENFSPKYVEVSFNNTCNFKCSYCGPTFSSKWTEEIRQQGPYTFSNYHSYNAFKEEEKLYRENDDNPYITAFWKWFPDAVKQMHTFRITGGEPLLSKHTFKVIDYLIENPQPNLNFAINTNACPPDALWSKFIEKIKILEEQKIVNSTTIFVSAESTGKQAEYSRDGMDWKMFSENVESLLKITNRLKLSFMCAFNVFSLPTFKNFLEYILMLKQTYVSNNIYEKSRVSIDTPYVRNPQFLDIKISNEYMVNKFIKESLDFMIDNQMSHHKLGFFDIEVSKFRLIYADCINRLKLLDESVEETYKINMARIQFVEFVNQYDKRRNKNFLETFPELQDFYNDCVSLKNV